MQADQRPTWKIVILYCNLFANIPDRLYSYLSSHKCLHNLAKTSRAGYLPGRKASGAVKREGGARRQSTRVEESVGRGTGPRRIRGSNGQSRIYEYKIRQWKSHTTED